MEPRHYHSCNGIRVNNRQFYTKYNGLVGMDVLSWPNNLFKYRVEGISECPSAMD